MPIDKFLKEGDREELISRNGSKAGDVIYFIADTAQEAPKLAGQIRTEVAKRLDLIDTSRFEMCFIVDFPMFERDEETNKIIFTHNPFSMPQGGLDSLLNKNPEEVLAYQYDIGNAITSLMFSSSVRSIIIRSTPGAIPACGGAPYWNAL